FLDLPRRVEVMQLLRRLAHETGRAILLSSHDLDLALRHADRLFLLPKSAAMQIGAPEDLVLNGAFETTFHSEGVHFDVATGAFRAHEETIKTVALHGAGVKVLWTQRALERAGYKVDSTAAMRIDVNGSSWRLH